MKNKHLKKLLYLIASVLFIYPIFIYFPFTKNEGLGGVALLASAPYILLFFWAPALIFFGLGKYFSGQDKTTPDIITQYKVSSAGQNARRTATLILLAVVFILVILKITSLNF